MLPISEFNKQPKNDFNLIGKIKVKLLLVITISALILMMAQLVFAASLATDGQKLSLVEQKIASLDSQNTSLKIQIAQESSLASLLKKASELGFVKPSKIISL